MRQPHHVLAPCPGSARAPALLAFACVLASGACGGGGEDPPPYVVHTLVAKTTLAAGERVYARCDLLDLDGEPVLDDNGDPLSNVTQFAIAYQHQDSFATDDEDEIVAARVGTATVRCSAPELGLVGEPVELEIVPGPALRVFTQLATTTAPAGVAVGVTCVAFDGHGNTVPDFAHSLAIAPFGASTTVTGSTVAATAVGDYEVTCVVAGAASVEEAYLQVVPALPASLLIGLSPDRPFYAIGDQVTVVAEAHDEFANRVDGAALAYAAAPQVPSPSPGRFRFNNDGVFTLSASVTSPTLNAVALDESVQVNVNSTGPAITCMRADAQSTPAQAYMIQAGPSTQVIPVRVVDTFPVQSVRLNGVNATFNASTGNYQAGVPIAFGMNYVEVVATDQLGLESSTVCFVAAAAQYTGETSHMTGALALRLDQAAIGGGAPGVLDSLNDILHAILSSGELRSMVNAGILASNPIHNGSCGVFACEPRVTYNNNTITWGAPSSVLTLRPGGLNATVTLPNVRLTVNACGTTCCIGGSTIAVTASSVTASMSFNLQLQGGLLRAAVSGTPVVTVGNVSLDGSGFCGFVVNLIQGFFTGTVRNAIRDALVSFLNSDVGPLLDGVVSSLDITSFGDTFAVPRLSGPGTVQLNFGLAYSSLDISTARFLLGIGTRFTPGTNAHTRASRGVPRRVANPLLDPSGTTAARPVALALHEGTLNQVLHALWRGGFFQATLALGSSGTATIDAHLPPIVEITGGTGHRARMTLGGVQSTVTIPGVITTPVPLMFGGVASAPVSLVGNDLRFGTLVLDRLYVATTTPLTQGQRNSLENLLRQVLDDMLISAISDGLPAFPIPAFTLPPAVSAFGLPANAELGIVSPVLSTSGSHYVLTGGFGVRN